jgi:hypothetical protein
MRTFLLLATGDQGEEVGGAFVAVTEDAGEDSACGDAGEKA